MRSVHTTTVNVAVNDHQDRANVVTALRCCTRRLCLFLREALEAIALLPAKPIAQPGFGVMYVASSGSPSWGGHRWSGGSGSPSRS